MTCVSPSCAAGRGGDIHARLSAAMDTECLRRRFQPAKVAILFVGKSPPANGTFFYKGDLQVFRYMREAFSKLDRQNGDCDTFLSQFKSLGCYLDDLVLTPINYATASERSRKRKEGVKSLAARISDLSPHDVVAIGRSIRREVQRTVVQSGVQAAFHCVAFPGTGRQREFRDNMICLLPKLFPDVHRETQ